LTEVALKAVPKGSFRIDSVKKAENVATSQSANSSFKSRFLDDSTQLDKNGNVTQKINVLRSDNDTLNLTKKSLKKASLMNTNKLDTYYDFDVNEDKTVEGKAEAPNKLNLINRFREKQTRKFEEQQELEK
jgi:hypothetical protein